LRRLWTEVCVVLPVLSALSQGYEVYVVTDASGGVSPAAHEHAIQRMVQGGAVPVTWVQVLLELQRDWARKETPRPGRRILSVLAMFLGALAGAFLMLHADFWAALAPALLLLVAGSATTYRLSAVDAPWHRPRT